MFHDEKYEFPIITMSTAISILYDYFTLLYLLTYLPLQNSGKCQLPMRQ
jgi:hypothetical protein